MNVLTILSIHISPKVVCRLIVSPGGIAEPSWLCPRHRVSSHEIPPCMLFSCVLALPCVVVSLWNHRRTATTRKTLIGRNTFCGALKGACATKLFLWRIMEDAPQNLWNFCGACTASAPQKFCGSHAGSNTAHGRRILCGACDDVRHRKWNFCGAYAFVRHTNSNFCGAYADVCHRSLGFCGAH
jgi:hypothetical protein